MKIVKWAVLTFAALCGVAIIAWIGYVYLKERDQGPRRDCVHHLHVLGVPLHQYAKTHGGAFPSKWSDLSPEYLNYDALVCHTEERAYRKAHGVPLKLTSPADADARGSYVLVPGLHLTDDPNTVLAYERDGHHGDTGHAILLLDGRGDWDPPTVPH